LDNRLTPKIIDIGTVHGFCDARCVMCPIATMQTSHIMTDEKFSELIGKLEPHNGTLERVNIVGMGETILDKHVVNKVTIAKRAGFFVSIITNGHALTTARSRALLDAGLDEILFSVDSTSKEHYEAIRVGLSFDRVIANVHEFIKLRNEKNYQTRIFVRIVVQETNRADRLAFTEYWKTQLRVDEDDLVLSFPEHNWPLPDAKQPGQKIVEKTVPCQYIFDRLVVDAEGNVQFCCVDNEADFFPLGNVFEADPIELFNGHHFRHARELMSSCRINEIDPCKFCNVPVKRLERAILSTND
jgi:sulfatase maturation enzyme AslB (radical SAM superfamily)